MEATIYLGARDVEERMQYGRAIPPRVFAAKAYTLSGMDKARELIEGQKKDLSSQESLILANDFVEKLVGIRTLVANLVLHPEHFDRLMEVSHELRAFEAKAVELQNDISKSMFILLSAPFLFSTFWGVYN